MTQRGIRSAILTISRMIENLKKRSPCAAAWPNEEIDHEEHTCAVDAELPPRRTWTGRFAPSKREPKPAAGGIRFTRRVRADHKMWGRRAHLPPANIHSGPLFEGGPDGCDDENRKGCKGPNVIRLRSYQFNINILRLLSIDQELNRLRKLCPSNRFPAAGATLPFTSFTTLSPILK